jgi:hypothetical protein
MDGLSRSAFLPAEAEWGAEPSEGALSGPVVRSLAFGHFQQFVRER